MFLMSALKGNERSAMKVAECLMEGRGAPTDSELALRMLIALADGGVVEAQESLRSMTDYDLASCDGEDLRSSGFPEGSWGRRVMERIDAAM